MSDDNVYALKASITQAVFELNGEITKIAQLRNTLGEIGTRVNHTLGTSHNDDARYAINSMVDPSGIHDELDRLVIYYHGVIRSLERYRDNI
jgi:hypothetical protein